MNKKDRKIYGVIEDAIRSIKKESILIGVDGGQGSGKSTFLKKLKKYLDGRLGQNIVSIETDDFLIEREKREHLSEKFFKSDRNLDFLFNFTEAAKAIRKLATSKNKSITIGGLYNHSNGKRDRKVTYVLESRNIVLVGGPYLLHPKLPKLDLAIFIHATREKRFGNGIMRAEKRDRSLKSQRVVFDKFENFYSFFADKIDKYDVVIDNNDFDNRKIVKVSEVQIV